MNSTTVYDMFDPDRLGWLKYRHEKKLEIRKDDIIRLMQVDPMNACDPLMQSYLLLALKGKLNGRRGRPAGSIGKKVRYWVAWMEYQERLAAAQLARRSGLRRRNLADLEPSIAIAEAVAREHRLHVSGRGFLTAVSRMKKEDNSRE